MTAEARAGLYERVSRFATAADRKRARSIDQQNTANRAGCAEHGWTVAATYADAGLSASRFATAKGGSNREGYRRMASDVAAGRLDVLVVWEPARGSRELESWASLLNACRRTGTRIFVTSHDRLYDMADSTDWKTLADEGVDSTHFSDKLSVAIRRGKASARKLGTPAGPVIYGTRRVYDPESGAWQRDEADPQTSPIAAEIVTRGAAGESWTDIARSLNGRDIASPAGKTWSGQAVARIAGTPLYGDLGIVQMDVSLAARARQADRSRKGERPNMATYRYSLTMRCATCAGPVRGGAHGKAGRLYYYCIQGCAYIGLDAADRFLDAVAVDRLSRPDAMAAFAAADDAAVLGAEAEAAGYRRRIEVATKSFTAGRIPIEALEAIAADCDPKAKAAGKRARELRTPSALAGLPDENRAIVAARWNALSLSARKAAMRALCPDLELRRPPRGHMPADEAVDLRVIPWPDAL
jgi:DNA invertase Pin-like site-specific DNA recombinase